MTPQQRTTRTALTFAHTPDQDVMADVTDLTPLLTIADAPVTPRAQRATNTPRYTSSENTDILPRTPQHRRQPTSAAKGRVMIAAMAAGAAAAATYTAVSPRDQVTQTRTVLATEKTPIPGAAPASRGVQLVSVRPAANAAVHAEELAKGVAYAAERAEREARLQRPLFVMPTKGMFTSGFGFRWGALHAGIDLAAPIGTPIYAVTDGTVIESGPASGCGQWVRVQQDDGTIGVFGHVDQSFVKAGQKVKAGDQIATVGNRGNSTGPHLHYEVWDKNGTKINPQVWLKKRGVDVD